MTEHLLPPGNWLLRAGAARVLKFARNRDKRGPAPLSRSCACVARGRAVREQLLPGRGTPVAGPTALLRVPSLSQAEQESLSRGACQRLGASSCRAWSGGSAARSRDLDWPTADLSPTDRPSTATTPCRCRSRRFWANSRSLTVRPRSARASRIARGSNAPSGGCTPVRPPRATMSAPIAATPLVIVEEAERLVCSTSAADGSLVAPLLDDHRHGTAVVILEPRTE